jgi:hypothetical protein
LLSFRGFYTSGESQEGNEAEGGDAEGGDAEFPRLDRCVQLYDSPEEKCLAKPSEALETSTLRWLNRPP